jgi:hypothetical protein
MSDLTAADGTETSDRIAKRVFLATTIGAVAFIAAVILFVF